MIATGSRPAAGSNVAWLDRGARCLAARPAAARSAGVTHGRGVHVSFGGGPGAQAASSSSGEGILDATFGGLVGRVGRGVVMGR